jgi:hypothetical protein
MGSGFNAASQLISLPKGRGAVEGIAAIKMRRKLFAIGNFSVQIALPPGPSGFKPQLNLVCTTGNGKSPFGFGWVLGVPGASRRTPKGVPRYGDLTDSFPLSGSEHLVPVTTPVADIIQYRPRTEGLFAQIFHHNAPPDNYCEVKIERWAYEPAPPIYVFSTGRSHASAWTRRELDAQITEHGSYSQRLPTRANPGDAVRHYLQLQYSGMAELKHESRANSGVSS